LFESLDFAREIKTFYFDTSFKFVDNIINFCGSHVYLHKFFDKNLELLPLQQRNLVFEEIGNSNY